MSENNIQSEATVYFSLIGIDLSLLIQDGFEEYINSVKLNVVSASPSLFDIRVVITNASLSSFNYLDGYRYYSTDYHGFLSRNYEYEDNYVFSIDLTSKVKTRLENGYEDMVLELYPTTEGRFALSKYFYSTRNSNVQRLPNVAINYDEPYYYPFSGAWNYREIIDNSFNCFGYAMASKKNLLFDGYSFVSKLVFQDEYNQNISYYNMTNLQSIILNYNNDGQQVTIRSIASYDSPINNEEYRIAFRQGHFIAMQKKFNYYDVFLNHDFHFIVQNIDGTWSEKPGQAKTRKTIFSGNDPSYSFWDSSIDLNDRKVIHNFRYKEINNYEELILLANDTCSKNPKIETVIFLPDYAIVDAYYNSQTLYFAVTR